MRRIVLALCSIALGLSACTAPVTRQSVADDETQANGTSGGPDVSDDGRYVLFVSTASNLVANDTNAATDAFVRDTVAGTTTRVSVGANGAQANGGTLFSNAFGPQTAITPDGDLVAFVSSATNLDSSVTNRASTNDVFVRDLITGTTETISTDGSGSTLTSNSFLEGVSTDGRYVLFESAGTVYLTDRVTDTRSVIVDGTDPFGVCGALAADGVRQARMNGNATKIAFEQRCRSAGSTTNDVDHVVIFDRTAGTATNVHRFTTSRTADGLGRMSYAADAEVLVWAEASNTQPTSRIMAWLPTDGTVALIASSIPLQDPFASRTGRYVAFTKLVGSATQVWVFDRNIDGLSPASVATDGSTSSGASPTIANDETTLVFLSGATDLVTGDTNATNDIFTTAIDTVFGRSAAPLTVAPLTVASNAPLASAREFAS